MTRKYFSDNKTISKTLEISEGLLSTLTDMILFTVFFGFEASVAGYGRSWKASRETNKDLDEVNYKSIKRAIIHLKQKGLIESIEVGGKISQITSAGRIRLQSLLPKYDKKRVRDHRIYMITYDLPITKNNDRNRLRSYLKSIGCGLLQESVWITPYNPTKLIEEFVTKNNLDGNLIIVSSIGRDGAVGNFDVNDLINKVYNLFEVNEKYQSFIDWVKQGKLPKTMIVSRYLLVLKEDPQLPFELLPEGWLGNRAFQLFSSLSGKNFIVRWE